MIGSAEENKAIGARKHRLLWQIDVDEKEHTLNLHCDGSTYSQLCGLGERLKNFLSYLA